MGFPSVPEQVQIGDIPVPQIVDDTVEEQVTERIQEQIGLERIKEQGGDFPAPIVDDTVEIHVTERIRKQILPERVEEQIGSIPVPQIVDDTVEVVIGNVQVIAAAGSVGVSTAPVHGQARRELFEETTQKSVEIPTDHEPMTDEIFRKLETIIDGLSPSNGLTHLAVLMESITAKVENVALMSQRTNMSPLPDPSEAVPWKRRTKSSLCLRSWRI